MSDVTRRVVRAAVSLAVTAALAAALALWQPSGLYLWLKAAHVVAVIVWMGGMLHLPRLFVHHCEAEAGSRQSEMFQRMERRLLTVIINPAMIAAWALGLWLAWNGGWLWSDWFHAKLALVVALSGLHGFYARWVADFARERNRHARKFYIVVNALQTITMTVVVVLAVVKPF